MKIAKIKSQRNYKTAPSFYPVFEWEDIISKDYPLKLVLESEFKRKIHRLIDRLKLTIIAQYLLPERDKKSLRFIMKVSLDKTIVLNKNTIPILIDFWLEKSELNEFYTTYSHCPLVLISSAEVMSLLEKNSCPLNIMHFPLSISDKYNFSELSNFEKTFEFSFIGRPDNLFKQFLERYEQEFPDFVYVLSRGSEKNREYWTNKGHFIAKDNGRRSYFDMIKKTKITCYSTPGIDNSKIGVTEYNQVTPRLLEMTAGGCYVICRYTDNPDTDYYNLSSFFPNISTYEEFKEQLSKYRLQDSRSMKECALFLDQHYTSKRVAMLKLILKDFSN